MGGLDDMMDEAEKRHKDRERHQHTKLVPLNWVFGIGCGELLEHFSLVSKERKRAVWYNIERKPTSSSTLYSNQSVVGLKYLQQLFR